MRNIYILHKRIANNYLLIYTKFSIEKYKVIYYKDKTIMYNSLLTTEKLNKQSNDFLSYIYKLFR